MLLEKSIIINLLCELLRLAIACAVPRGHKRNEAHLSGFYAYAALREIVTMMSANIIDAAAIASQPLVFENEARSRVGRWF